MAEETEIHKCEICNKIFGNVEALDSHNKAKHSELALNKASKEKSSTKKSLGWLSFVIIAGIVLFGMVWAISSAKTLPPTDMLGHVEENPLSHVLKEPMPISIQKHMLEHADGTGKPGVIINYNCKDYSCEDDLIENLENFAGEYNYVYIAPFKGMDAKIALTKLERIDVLEEYDKTKITDFIEGF